MRISNLIDNLEAIKNRFGDIELAGGRIDERTTRIATVVLNDHGCEIFPRDPNAHGNKHPIAGFFLEGR